MAIYKIPLQRFLNFYNNYENRELLHEQMWQFTSLYSSGNRRVILQIFYLLIFISYKEQIQLKSFKIVIFTESIMDKKFICPASFKVCLVACLLHWSRLQKGISNTFDGTDLKEIHTYILRCEDTVFHTFDGTDLEKICNYVTVRLSVRGKIFVGCACREFQVRASRDSTRFLSVNK